MFRILIIKMKVMAKTVQADNMLNIVNLSFKKGLKEIILTSTTQLALQNLKYQLHEAKTTSQP